MDTKTLKITNQTSRTLLARLRTSDTTPTESIEPGQIHDFGDVSQWDGVSCGFGEELLDDNWNLAGAMELVYSGNAQEGYKKATVIPVTLE